jgi:hypothetical protein
MKRIPCPIGKGTPSKLEAGRNEKISFPILFGLEEMINRPL